MSPARSLLLAIGTTSALACATQTSENAGRYTPEEDEQRLLDEGAQLEEELRQHGLLFEHPDVEAYLEGIATAISPRTLSPEFRFGVRIVRDPRLESFSTANGTIFLNTGVLSHLQDEAQLAMLLRHEMTHVLERHLLEDLRGLKRGTIMLKLLEIYEGDDLDLLHSQFRDAFAGFSSEQEKAADLEALRGLQKAGYSVRSAASVYSALLQVSPHPLLIAPAPGESGAHLLDPGRADACRELLSSLEPATAEGGRLGARDLREAMAPVVFEDISLRLRHRLYLFALEELDRNAEAYAARAELHYLRGEAHRRIAEDPEGAGREKAQRRGGDADAADLSMQIVGELPLHLERARSSYRRALEIGDVRAHLGLGHLERMLDNRDAAVAHFRRYLREAPTSFDAAHVEHLLRELTSPERQE